MDDADSPTNPPYGLEQHVGLDRPSDRKTGPGDQAWYALAEFTLHDQIGSKNFAEQSAPAAIEALTLLQLPDGCLTGLETAVERAALNALEHRDRLHSQLPISMCIYAPKVADSPGVDELSGKSCGWGYFIIQKITDSGSGSHPLIQLFLYQEGNI